MDEESPIYQKPEPFKTLSEQKGAIHTAPEHSKPRIARNTRNGALKISEAELSALTLYTPRELRGLVLRGFIPGAAAGFYPRLEAIEGCFKARKAELSEGFPGIFESMSACATSTGIPRAVLKAAKAAGAGFKGGRVELRPLLKWAFSAGGENTNWGDRHKRAQALSAELELRHQQGETLIKSEVTFALNKAMSLLFSLMDRRSNLELPSACKGLEERQIQSRLLASDEQLKEQFRDNLSGLMLAKNGH